MKIELKKWSIEDKESLIRICNTIDRNYLSDRLPNPYTNESAEWWLNVVKENEGKTGIFREIIVDGKIIGTISVEQKEDVYRKDAEIGYYLLPEEYSKGIMTEAVRQICETAFEKLDIIRITGLVYEPNIASRKVLEKNNFILEDTMKKAVIKNNNIYDLCIYGKNKKTSETISRSATNKCKRQRSKIIPLRFNFCAMEMKRRNRGSFC